VPVGDDHAWLEKVLVEVELLANLAHPNLVSYRHVWLEDVQLTRFGPSVACAFILQQYCNGGDLLRYVLGDIPKQATKEELKARIRRRSRGQSAERPKPQKRLSAEEIYSLFKDITSGLAYLHASNYIHRDLKPSNCLLHRDGHQLKCLISDFGEVQPENAMRNSTGSTGTISYCAPEVLKKDASGRYGNFTTKSDMFALGMILYFMCFGGLPYVNANSINEELEDIDQLRAEIIDWKGFHAEKKLRPDLPPKLYHLLTRLLAVNPADRPSASEVLNAMAGESLDSMPRTPRLGGPMFGLSGQRIQNLDSPLPPNTPVPGLSVPDVGQEQSNAHATPEPTKRARVNSVPDEEGASKQTHDADTATSPPTTLVPASPSQRLQPGAHTMVLSRSRRSHHSPSPDRGPSRSPHRNINSGISASTATTTTPLLMPPPTTRVARLRHDAFVAHYHMTLWLSAHATTLRLMLFAAKIFSLSWVCWPYSAGWAITTAAVMLAACDLYGDGTQAAGTS
jgi:serine/threonine protein kinase